MWFLVHPLRAWVPYVFGVSIAVPGAWRLPQWPTANLVFSGFRRCGSSGLCWFLGRVLLYWFTLASTVHGCDGLLRLRLLVHRRQGISIGAWFLGHARLYHLQPLPLPSRAHTMCVLGSAWLHFLCCGLHLGAHFVIIVIIPPFFHGR